MAVLRIKPNILSDDFEASRAFYEGVVGLDERRFFVRDPNGAVINVTQHA